MGLSTEQKVSTPRDEFELFGALQRSEQPQREFAAASLTVGAMTHHRSPLDPMFGFQSYGVVENLVVLDSHRGLGLGRALMNAVEQEARQAKCTKLMLLSSASRTDAHQFFARLDFDGEKKRGFVKYLNRSAPSEAAAVIRNQP